MTDLRKAAEMALEALDHFNKGLSTVKGEFSFEIDALRQALAQEGNDLQEAIKRGSKAWAGVDPTKWVDELRGEDTKCKDHPDAPHSFDRNASLTEDRYVCECEYWEPPAQPEQEPVAHLWECIGRWTAMIANDGKDAELAPPDWLVDAIEAATTPPKREWVGLTKTERFQIEKSMSKYYDYQHECKTVCLPEFAAAIEAKLKEKNT